MGFVKWPALVFTLTLALGGCVHLSQASEAAVEQAPVRVSEAHSVVLQTTANKDIHRGYVDTLQGQLHYWQAGEGPPILFIHQAASSTEEYAAMVPYLKDDYRLVSFDLPGHGMSDDPDRELLIDDFTTSAIELLDHLEIDRAHVFGNHGGALIAMNLAWKHPERVDHIMLAGTSGLKDMEAVRDFSDSLGLHELNRIDRDGQSLSDAWGRFTNYMPTSEPGRVLVAFMNNVTVRVRPFDAHYALLKFDRRPAVAAIKDKPILLLQGENDPFVSNQEMLLQVFSNAKRSVIENAGVFALFEQPQAHADAIKLFLEQH